MLSIDREVITHRHIILDLPTLSTSETGCLVRDTDNFQCPMTETGCDTCLLYRDNYEQFLKENK